MVSCYDKYGDMMIRRLISSDIPFVSKIWLNGNLEAHNFVISEHWYSIENKAINKIITSECYVYLVENKICGYIAINDGYIEHLYVVADMQKRGIGKQLVEFCKNNYKELSLHVFKKNKKAVDFYLKQDFSIIKEELEDETGEIGYFMVWSKNSDRINK